MNDIQAADLLAQFEKLLQGLSNSSQASQAPTEPGFAELVVAAGFQAKPFYHVSEISKTLGITESSIYRDIKAGKLKNARYGANRILVRPAWVDTWLEGCTQ